MCVSFENESNDKNEVLCIRERLKDYIIHNVPKLEQFKELDFVLDQAFFEVIKRVYDKEMKQTKKSMEKTFFYGITDKKKTYIYDSSKQKYKRDLRKIEKYRHEEGEKYEALCGVFPEAFKKLKNETDCSKSNFESNHYNISNQNSIEIETFSKLAIYEKILKKQISSVKKVSNTEFKDLYKEYDNHFISKLSKASSPEITDNEYIAILIDFFNFEDKVSLEFIYTISDYAVKNNISDEVFDRVKFLYASPLLIAGVTCMNRSFFLRDMYIPLLLSGDGEVFSNHLNQYQKDLFTVCQLKERYISDNMIECIPKSELVKYLKGNYNLFTLFNQNKTWESKKIRLARKIFGQWSGQGVI